MRLDMQTWDRWCDWTVRIRDDVSDLVNDQAIFEGFREVIEANGAWIDALEGNLFIEFIKRGYVAKSVLGIRRHLKSKDDSVSLKRLLEQIRARASQLTFDFYIERHPRSATPWQEPTFRLLSSDGRKVSTTIIDQDLAALAGLNKDIEAMADRSLAHLDKRGFEGSLTFGDLRNAVATFNELACKYVAFLLAEGYSSLEASILYNWKRLFKHPWDRRPA